MHAITVTDAHHRYTRINKRTARALWGIQLLALCPAKLRPGFPWATHLRIHPRGWLCEKAFDAVVGEFEHFNCSYDAGYYTAFYTVEDLPVPQGSTKL